MAKKTITLNGGLVTSKPPSLLDEGDLALAQGVEYLPGSVSPSKLEGFEAFSVQASIHCPFLAFASFKSGYEAVLKTGYLSAGSAGLTTSIEAIPMRTGTDVDAVPGNIFKTVNQIDCIYYDDEYFLLFGGNSDRSTANDVRNFVFSGKVSGGRYHGMLPNADLSTDTVITNTYSSRRRKGKTKTNEEPKPEPRTPHASPDSGSGTGFTLPTGSSISYWIEERIKDSSGNIVRRNVGTSASVITLSGKTGTTFKPVITRPAVVNSDATHWALYGTAAGSVYPSGFQIDEVPITDTTIEDTRTGASPSAPSGPAYPVLSANIAGVVITVPKYGTAPLATVGDEFEGSLCTDDPDVPGLLRYSLAGDFDHFPVINGIQVGKKDGEKITMIKRLGRSLIVGTDLSLYRVATLPRADQDAGFNLDRTVELLEEDFGVVGQKMAVRFTSPQGPQLAYLTSGGLRSTDGADTMLLTPHLKWRSHVEVSQLESSFMLNNPEKFRLEFYFAQTDEMPTLFTVGGRTNTLPALPTHSLHVYYDRSQIRRDGLPKITGPHPIAATAGCLVREGVRKRVYLATVQASNVNTHVVKADGGDSFIINTTEEDISIDLKTGMHYLGGIGGAAKLGSVSLHHGEGAPYQEVRVERTVRNEGQEDLTTGDSVALDHEGLSTMSTLAYGSGEGFQFEITHSDSRGAFNIDFVLADFDSELERSEFSKV